MTASTSPNTLRAEAFRLRLVDLHRSDWTPKRLHDYDWLGILWTETVLFPIHPKHPSCHWLALPISKRVALDMLLSSFIDFAPFLCFGLVTFWQKRGTDHGR